VVRFGSDHRSESWTPMVRSKSDPGSETPEIGEGGPRQAYSPAAAGGGPHVLLVVGMRSPFRPVRGGAGQKKLHVVTANRR
jgi:hypothetical protein